MGNNDHRSPTLPEGTERLIFGFDYRRLPIWSGLPTAQQAEFRPSDLMSLKSYPATLSEGIWPSAVDKKSDTLRNGAELFDVDIFLSLPAPDLQHSCAVAFDIASTEISLSSAQGWFKPTPSQIMPLNFDWVFAGYDVADDWLQFSALYGFSWDKDIQCVTDDPLIKFNGVGIFANELSARNAIVHFKRLAPEHKPYFACGVWIGRKK